MKKSSQQSNKLMMPKTTITPENKISLNLFQDCLEKMGFEVKFYYDLVEIYIDSANKKTRLNKLNTSDLIGRQEILQRTLPHYDTMNFIIDAHQPNQTKQKDTYLEQLKNRLNGDYVITYVEFAMDIICKDKKKTDRLRNLLNELLVFQRKKDDEPFYHGIGNPSEENPTEVKNTHYFGQRSNTYKNNLVMYSDRPSKKTNTPCVHLELRFFGSTILKKLGIYSLQDLIHFKRENLWDHYLDLRDVNYTELGALLNKGKKSLPDKSTLRRHGKQLYENFSGTQELMVNYPEYADALMPINDRRKFESRLKAALKPTRH